MASKLIVLRTSRDGAFQQHTILYVYPISPRIADFNGAEVPPLNRSQLSSDAAAVLLEVDKAAIDVGDTGFEQVSRQQTAGESNAAFATRLLTDHAVRMPVWIQARRDEVAMMGRGVD